jgi:hypothetical protein
LIVRKAFSIVRVEVKKAMDNLELDARVGKRLGRPVEGHEATSMKFVQDLLLGGARAVRAGGVLCFNSPSRSIAEVQRFAEVIGSRLSNHSFPFIYSPKTDRGEWNDLEQTTFRRKLEQLGYDFYSCAPVGGGLIPYISSAEAWTIFDDVQRSSYAAKHLAA